MRVPSVLSEVFTSLELQPRRLPVGKNYSEPRM